MKFLAEAQVAVLVTALLLGIGTIATCAVVLGSTSDADRPSWIDPALGMVPLAVALLAWAGALCVYTVAYLLSRFLQETTWVASVRADIFLLTAFLIWGFVANVCMSVAVGLSIDAHKTMGSPLSHTSDDAGVAAAVLTWIIVVMLGFWLAIEVIYIKFEYGRLAAVWSQSLRVLTPMRVRRGEGVNLDDPPSEKLFRRSFASRPTTYPIHRVIPPLPRKARLSMMPGHGNSGEGTRRERSSGVDGDRDAARRRLERAEHERQRQERRERRQRRRERRERRRAAREAAENAAAANGCANPAEGGHDHTAEHCPTCGSHSRHWNPSRAAPTSPLRPEEFNQRPTHYSIDELVATKPRPLPTLPTLPRRSGPSPPLPKLPSESGSEEGPAPEERPLPKTPTSPASPTSFKTPTSPVSPISPVSPNRIVSPSSPQIGEFSHEPGFEVPLSFLSSSAERLKSMEKLTSAAGSKTDLNDSSSPTAGPSRQVPYLSPHYDKDYYNDRLSRPTIKSLDLKSTEE